MIKLKSLFRRGQGSASSSSKHSGSSSNNNRNKSQSTTSLNSAVDNSSGVTSESAAAAGTPPASKFYPNLIDSTRGSERGVDVGFEELSVAPGTTSEVATQVPSTQTCISTNTLSHKKSKTVSAKRIQKQPKQLPIITKTAVDDVNSSRQQQLHRHPTTTATTTTLHTEQPRNDADYVIMSLAAAQVNSVVSLPTTTAITLSEIPETTAVPTLLINNNHHPETFAVHMLATESDGESSDYNKLNAAAAIAPNYQFINNEQQFVQISNSKMQELQSQLERIGHEKLLLEERITELLPYQHEVPKLKSELSKIQNTHEKSQMEIATLKYENETLRNRLRDVVNSPLSDTEKHQIIQDSQRLHSSAPASIALPNPNENDVGTICLTSDWDKQSSSSEVFVACLQDKIIQMEETHYSTNEELQATLQELADLQSQLTDAHTENERLSEEKDVLFQSLCRQTEKLNESRTQITSLQELLLRDAKQAEVGTSEREKKLVNLIKTSQDERETILAKQEEMNSELQELRQSLELNSQENTRCHERIAMLESTIDAANAERKQMDSQLLQAKDEISQRAIEISRLTTLLDNARSKIDELEQDLARGEKTDLTDVLDAARKEKDVLEVRVAELQNQCSHGQAEIRRIKDQLSGMTEECKVAKNNAKCVVSHLEYRLEQLQQEKDKLSADYQQLFDSTAELQIQCKCHLENKTQLRNLLNETEKHLGEIVRKLNETEELLENETKLRKQEAEEWQQFQSDLLMTVRVANDFKTEALSAREQLVLDNKTQKEKIRLLEQQIEKFNKLQIQQNETQQSVLSSVQHEMATRRNKIGTSSFNRLDSRLSVKTLIESIENNKSKAEETESHYSSTSSLNSATPETTQNFNPVSINSTQHANEWNENIRLPVVESNNSALNTKGPLREQSQSQSLVTSMHFSSLNNISKSLLSGDRKDPLNMLAKNGGSKRNALLKWCQNKTVGYRNIDITNFSSSWNDGLAFCAILHSYLPDCIPYDTLSQANKRRNFSLAFAAAESVNIPTTLNINDMCQIERPDWTQVMTYVTAIYKHFET